MMEKTNGRCKERIRILIQLFKKFKNCPDWAVFFYMSNNPIVFFDSGIGGITLWKEVHNLLPYENKIYLADSKNLPYGTKSDKEIERISFENSEFLKKECKMIIVACNTTTKCIEKLRKNLMCLLLELNLQ